MWFSKCEFFTIIPDSNKASKMFSFTYKNYFKDYRNDIKDKDLFEIFKSHILYNFSLNIIEIIKFK